jgi:hypothetical protein
MDASTKDAVQVVAWVVAIIGGLIAAFKALHETAENRRMRARELRWKKAQFAKEILDQLDQNKRFRDALTMLDWTGREFEISQGKIEEISWEDLSAALRTWHEPMSFTDKEVYIRDCFDELFDGMNMLEHYLRTELLSFQDVQFPMAYHITKLRERWSAVDAFLGHYGFQLALAFVNRFPEEVGAPANKPLQPPSGAKRTLPVASTDSAARG